MKSTPAPRKLLSDKPQDFQVTAASVSQRQPLRHETCLCSRGAGPKVGAGSPGSWHVLDGEAMPWGL